MHPLNCKKCMDYSMILPLNFMSLYQSNNLLCTQGTGNTLRTPANCFAATPRSTAFLDLIKILDKTKDINVPFFPLADGIFDVGISACKAELRIANDEHWGRVVAHGGCLEMA